MSPDELKNLIASARLTRQEAASRCGVSLRQLYDYLRYGVPSGYKAEGMRRCLRGWGWKEWE